MGKPEADVEKYLRAQAIALGYVCFKFTAAGTTGVPDRVLITPVGTIFVEVKRPGGPLRVNQERRIPIMRRAGAEVHVIDTRDQVRALLAELVERCLAAQNNPPKLSQLDTATRLKDS